MRALFRDIEVIALWLLVYFGLSFLAFFVIERGYYDLHFLWLAKAFLEGRADLPHAYVASVGPMMDVVFRDGRFFWPLGPLPAVLFMPFVAAFGVDMRIEAYAHLMLGVAAGVLSYVLARRLGHAPRNALWLSFAFCLGSVVIGVLFYSAPWHFENLLTAVLLLAALVERQGRRRPALIGVFLGLAMATRLTSALPALFFFVLELLERTPFRRRVARMAAMAAPMAVALALLGWYNVARFGDPFWTGQRDHNLGTGPLALHRAAYGVFDPVNIPVNFRKYFLDLPVVKDGGIGVGQHGLSALLLSPVFFWLAFARKRSPEFLAALVSTALLLPVLLSYFTSGFRQFGPRYLVELVPLWYLVLAATFRERGLGALPKGVIFGSAFVNVLLFILFRG